MLIFRLDEQTLVLTGLDLAASELLAQIPAAASVGENDAAHARLYTTPTHGKNPELDDDWKAFVEPDLRQLFQSAVEVVEEDLFGFPPPEPEPYYTLHIPMKHLGAWINALNQARLAIAARHSLTEEDLERPVVVRGDRTKAVSQVHFYGELQGWFLAANGGV